MKLDSDNGASVELTVVRYQFPSYSSTGRGDWDANWLIISARIAGADTWKFHDACLTTWEASHLGNWLDGIARGRIAVGEELAFTEPQIIFRLDDRSPSTVHLAVILSHEASPPNASDAVRFESGHEVSLVMSHTAIAEASAAWLSELKSYPER